MNENTLAGHFMTAWTVVTCTTTACPVRGGTDPSIVHGLDPPDQEQTDSGDQGRDSSHDTFFLDPDEPGWFRPKLFTAEASKHKHCTTHPLHDDC